MKPLFIKEFFSYFKSKFAYTTLLIYALVSMLCCFYIGKFFENASNNLMALFIFQPNIFAFIVPALAVKLWSEERKSNTIELLITQPVSYFDIVMAKFLSCFCFSAIMLILTVPFFLWSSGYINLDYLNILSSYLACLVSLLAICAIACTTASFNTSPAVGYISSLFAIWALFMLGFTANFSSILYGQIGLDNLIYFISITIFALSINTYYLKTKFVKNKKLLLFVFLQFLSGFLVIYLSNIALSSYKLDLSFSKSFSLSLEGKKILSSQPEPTIIDVYKSDWSDVDTKKTTYINNVIHFLSQLPNTTLNIKNITPFSKEEDEVINYKIEGLETQKYNLYAGIVFSNTTQNIVMQSLEPQDAPYLEIDVIRAIASLNQTTKPVIGIIDGKSSVLRKNYGLIKGRNWPFADELSKHYNLASLSKNIAQIPAPVDILLIVNQPQTPVIKYAIDQFLMRGGKVLILENNIDFNYQNKSFAKELDLEIYDGNFNSEFEKNIITQEQYAQEMLPHLIVSINEPKLVIINEHLIGNEETAEKKELQTLLKTLDYLSNNKIMISTSAKPQLVETDSLKDKIENYIGLQYEAKVLEIEQQINQASTKMIAINLNPSPSVAEAQEAETLKQTILKKQEELKKISYQVENKTKQKILFYMILNTIIFPLITILIMAFIFEVLRRRYVKIKP